MQNEWTLDFKVLFELSLLMEDESSDIIDEMMTCYVEDTSERLSDIRDALEKGDIQGLKQLAYKMKGSSSQIGAARLAALSAQLRISSEGTGADHLEPIVVAMEEEFDSFCNLAASKPWKELTRKK